MWVSSEMKKVDFQGKETLFTSEFDITFISSGGLMLDKMVDEVGMAELMEIGWRGSNVGNLGPFISSILGLWDNLII